MLNLIFESVHVVPDISAYAYPFETTLDLCQMGLGMAVVFRTEVYGAADQLQNKRLAVFPLREIKHSFTLGLVTKAGVEEDHELMNYVECAKRSAAEVTLEMDVFSTSTAPGRCSSEAVIHTENRRRSRNRIGGGILQCVYPRTAMASISKRPPLGRAETCTQDLAG